MLSKFQGSLQGFLFCGSAFCTTTASTNSCKLEDFRSEIVFRLFILLKGMGNLSLEKARKLRSIVKTWRRMTLHGWKRSMTCTSPSTATPGCSLIRSMTWHPLAANSDEEYWEEAKLSSSSATSMAPRGHMAVYVGEERERFVIKTEYINHPLFRMLLDEAEKEYGFHHEGPLLLPCQVASFHRILWMLSTDAHEHHR